MPRAELLLITPIHPKGFSAEAGRFARSREFPVATRINPIRD
jgi:hypothetical protein